LHHIYLNSILHISIFVQLYEVFLGIEPYFDLFTYLFHLKSQPNNKVSYKVGGAGLQLRQGMEKNTYRKNSGVVCQDGERSGSTSETTRLPCPRGLREHWRSIASGPNPARIKARYQNWLIWKQNRGGSSRRRNEQGLASTILES
jgi:hypothetical protein